MPNLEGVGRVSLDVEHRGLGREAVPVGLAVATADHEWYLPFGHPEGRQHSLAAIKLWCENNLMDKEIAFRAAKNDIEVLRRSGVAHLEGLDVKPREVQHAAALLDEHRRTFTLEALAQDQLGQGKLAPTLAGRAVPPAEIPELPAGVAAPYARRDARLTFDLDAAYRPALAAEGLERVQQLEDNLIYCTLHMERAMVKLDVPRLLRWVKAVRQAHQERVLELYRRTGLRINPNSPQDMVKLFKHLGQSFGHTLAGHASFTDAFLKKHLDIREVELAVEARDLDSLLTKYLLKYLKALTPEGYLPYQLHQLRADEYGTITGRYASSKVNIQQVFKPKKQVEQSPCTKAWIVRELFIPGEGDGFNLRFTVHDEANGDLNGQWFHTDADQIEYRLFAHFSCVPRPYSTRLIDAYNNNPNLNYHRYVHEELLRKCMSYGSAKNFNFGKLYGFGRDKAALMMGLNPNNVEHMAVVDKTLAQYDEAIPEARRLLWYCSDLAERRGYVRTILGRRRRYRPGDRFYSALNSVLQGSAADLMKLKLLRLYREMGALTTRALVEACLATQEHELRVPITWESGVGATWKEAM